MSITAKKGFTLIEVVIVVTVIIILTTISAIGINVYLTDARDQERASKTLIIAAALEKYYDNNGEYPTCTAMRGSPASVATLLGVDEDVFKTPTGPESPNAMHCRDSSDWPSATNDVFLYEPLLGPPTDPNEPRTWFEIIYWSEADKSMVSHASKRQP